MRGWDGIDEFVAVATSGSFSKAARAFGASPTHMSRSVAQLEARVQAQLFYRTTRVVRLTDTGRTFLAQCQHIIHARDEAIATINEHGEPQGELRLTCSTAMGERFVARIVREYAQAHPRVSVSIELTNRLVDLVAEGFDLAVRTGTLSDSRLTGTRIAARSLLTCASPHYLARAGTPAGIEDLMRHQCLIGTSRTWHFSENGQERVIRPKGRWHCNSGEAVIDAALADMGICQLPEFYVMHHVRGGRLVLLLEDHRPREQPIWAVYPQQRHQLPKTTALVRMLREQLPRALADGGGQTGII